MTQRTFNLALRIVTNGDSTLNAVKAEINDRLKDFQEHDNLAHADHGGHGEAVIEALVVEAFEDIPLPRYSYGKQRLLTADELSELMAMPEPEKLNDTPPPCNRAVFAHGETVGIFDMTKEKAEAVCRRATEITGTLHDWHRAGGRAVIKCLIKTGGQREKLREAYLDYFNNYLSPEKYAEHNGLTVDQAKTLLDLAREVANSDHPES